MKKSGIVFALLGAFTGVVSAQSSVTLFGVVDLAARSVKNGGAGTVQSLSSGGLYTSRFALRGEEDLGGGMKAAFHLEAGINADTGGSSDSTRFFNRRSTVGLITPMGEVRLGRDLNPTYLSTFQFEPFVAVGVGTVLNFTSAPSATLGSGALTTQRNDNSIGYFLPGNLGGVYGQVMVSAGEGTVGNKYRGGRLGYAAGPINVAVAYSRTDTAIPDDFVQSNIGASYSFGMAKLMALYHVVEFGALEQKTVLVGGKIGFGKSEIRASYAVNRRSGGAAGTGFSNDDDSELMALGYVYSLSKRTALYGTAARITNDGAARSVVSGAPPAGMLGGQNSSGYEVGLSHTF